MSFCSKCGTQQGSEASLCLSCGARMQKGGALKKVAVESEVPSLEPKIFPPKNIKLRGLLIIAGSAIAVIILFFVMLIPKPLKLTKTEAEDRLADQADFSFPVEDAGDFRGTIMDGSVEAFTGLPGSDCGKNIKVESIIWNEGTLLASRTLWVLDSLFTEDIVEFEDDKRPTEIIQLVKEGYEDPGCTYFDNHWRSSSLTNIGTSGDKLGKETPNSVYFERFDDLINPADQSEKVRKIFQVVVADGKYLIVISIDEFDSELSSSAGRSALKLALEKIYK